MRNDGIIQRLRQILREGPWKSKSEFARTMGMSPQAIGNILSDDVEREVPKSLLIGLARLNYNLTWFLYGTGPVKNYSQPEQEVLDLRHRLRNLEALMENMNAQTVHEELQSVESEKPLLTTDARKRANCM